MGLSWRNWRRWAAIAAAVIAGSVALMLLGRGTDLDSPEGVTRAFIVAAREGDRAAFWELLGPDSRARVERAAWDATQRVGGAKRFAPLDVLDVGHAQSSYVPTGIVVREQRADQAIVDVLGPDGRRDEVTLRRVDGNWRVELDWGEPASPPP